MEKLFVWTARSECLRDKMEHDPEIYHRANRFLQIGLAVGLVILLLTYAGLFKFDYGFFAGVICIVAGAAVRQIIVSRN